MKMQGLRGRIMRAMVKSLFPADIYDAVLRNGHIVTPPQRHTFHALSVKIAKYCTAKGYWKYFHEAPPRLAGEQKLLALTFDCDYDQDTAALARLCEILAEEQVVASFAVIGAMVKRDPQAYRLLIEHGHEIVNHSMTHPYHPELSPHRRFDHLSEAEAFTEMHECQEVLQELLAIRPVGFRTPHFLDNTATFRAAERMGFAYVSSVARDKSITGLPYYVAKNSSLENLSFCAPGVSSAERYPFIMLPLDCCPAHRGEPFCSYHTIRGDIGVPTKVRGQHPHFDEVIQLWSALLRREEQSGVVCVYFDPLDFVTSTGTEELLRSLIRQAKHDGWTYVSMEHLSRAAQAGLAQRRFV